MGGVSGRSRRREEVEWEGGGWRGRKGCAEVCWRWDGMGMGMGWVDQFEVGKSMEYSYVQQI